MSSRLKRFQIARKAADTKLHGLPHVAGSCFGIKKSDGKRTGQLCVTVLVRRKLPVAQLSPTNRIPSEVRRHGMDLPTDVIAVGKLRDELGFAINDGTQLGTVGAFSQGNLGFTALTCAHCITGGDRDFTTPDRITIEYPARGAFLGLGLSLTGSRAVGDGFSTEFGNFDAGLVSISSPSVIEYARTRPTFPVFRPPTVYTKQELIDLLEYLPVEGWGAGSDNIVRGRVAGLLVRIPPNSFDLMVEGLADQGLTCPGDSGLMWSVAGGQAFALHLGGDGTGPNNSSIHGFACFAFRVVDRFGLTLLKA